MKTNSITDNESKSVNKTFPWPVFDESDVTAVANVAKSGAWGNPDCGDLVEKFEKEFAAYCGSRFAATCANGSVALRLALIASGEKPGDEVIVPPYTFIATASIVIEANPDEVDYTKVHCPVAENACYEEAVWILQHAMLGTRDDMENFAKVIRKIQSI